MVAFGRIPEFDEASRDFPVRALLGPRRTPVSRVWRCAQFLDQGSEGACVGFSWTHELVAEPEEVPGLDEMFARQVYHRAQELDEWPGEDYEGTSVLAGAKATIESGWIVEYRWAFGMDDVLETLSYLGPVIFGINWYDGMMRPDPSGLIVPSGGIAGGHAILGFGVDVESQLIRLHNSWGPTWGLNGECMISWENMAYLLAQDGECCVPLVRTQVVVDPVEPDPVPPTPEPPLPPQPSGCWPGSDLADRARGLTDRARGWWRGRS